MFCLEKRNYSVCVQGHLQSRICGLDAPGVCPFVRSDGVWHLLCVRRKIAYNVNDVSATSFIMWLS